MEVLASLSHMDINNFEEYWDDDLEVEVVDGPAVHELEEMVDQLVFEDQVELVEPEDPVEMDAAEDEAVDEGNAEDDVDEGVEADSVSEFDSIISRTIPINMSETLNNFATNLYCCTLAFVAIDAGDEGQFFVCRMCYVRYCGMNDNGGLYDNHHSHVTVEYADTPTHHCYACQTPLFQLT